MELIIITLVNQENWAALCKLQEKSSLACKAESSNVLFLKTSKNYVVTDI